MFLFLIKSSLTRMALHALSRMETRKYHSGSSDSPSTKEDNGNLSDAESTLSAQTEATNSMCVICLEKFKDGQVSLVSFLFFSVLLCVLLLLSLLLLNLVTVSALCKSEIKPVFQTVQTLMGFLPVFFWNT